ncbi:unnamed protein product [Parajaminaea phylloscopi]
MSTTLGSQDAESRSSTADSTADMTATSLSERPRPSSQTQETGSAAAMMYADSEKQAHAAGDHARGEAPEQQPPVPSSKLVFAIAMTAIFVAESMNALDSNALGTAAPVIARDLDAYDAVSWLQSSYLLASVAFMLSWGRVYASFDGKWTFIACLVVFEVGSALCAAANSLGVFLAGRALAGIGGGGIFVGVWTTIGYLVSAERQATWISMSNIVWALWMKIGPLVAGGIIRDISWRWIFYINLPIGGAALLALVLFLPSLPAVHAPNSAAAVLGRDASILVRVKHFDFLGLVLSCGAAVAFIFPLLVGGTPGYAWTSAKVLGPLVSSPFIFALFVASQVRPGLDPSLRTLPVQLITRDWSIVLVLLLVASGGLLAIAPTFFLPVFFESVKGHSPMRAAVLLLPLIIMGTLSIGATAGVVEKRRVWIPFLIAGGMLCAVGGGLLYTTTDTTHDGVFVAWQIILGLGNGLAGNLPPIVLLGLAPIELLSAASSLGALLMNYGGLVGIAVGGAILNSRLAAVFHDHVEELVQQAGITSPSGLGLGLSLSGSSSSAAAAKSSLSPALLTAFTQAATTAFDWIWIAFVVASCLTVVLAALSFPHWRLPLRA